jgi:hypothetical protein
VQPHHLGIGGSLIDEHQPGRIEQALFVHPASACSRPHFTQITAVLALTS